MKATKEEIIKSYCNFIGRNISYSGLCTFEKVPEAFYNHLEVI